MDRKAYAHETPRSEFPKHVYSKDGATKIVHKASEIPDGWKDHPNDHKPRGEKEKLNAGKPDETTGKTPQTGAGGNGTGIAPGSLEELDADGHKWDAKLHAATKTKTSAGLWRMAPGKPRPAPAKGFPKPDNTDPVREQNAKAEANGDDSEKKFDL